MEYRESAANYSWGGRDLNTRLTELLHIEYPIVQGAMAWIADSSLASAVSAAGGLGIIAGEMPLSTILRSRSGK